MSKLLVEVGIAWEDMTWSVVDVEIEGPSYKNDYDFDMMGQIASDEAGRLMKPDIKDKVEHCWLYSYREKDEEE